MVGLQGRLGVPLSLVPELRPDAFTEFAAPRRSYGLTLLAAFREPALVLVSEQKSGKGCIIATSGEENDSLEAAMSMAARASFRPSEPSKRFVETLAVIIARRAKEFEVARSVCESHGICPSCAYDVMLYRDFLVDGGMAPNIAILRSLDHYGLKGDDYEVGMPEFTRPSSLWQSYGE